MRERVLVALWLFLVYCAVVVYAQDGCGNGEGVSEGARSIPLVVSNKQGDRMIPCAAGMKYLMEELGDAHLSVTAVFGKARKGKSFFLNNLIGDHDIGLDSESGAGLFSVGHSHRGHTKGFWILRPDPKNDVFESEKTGEKVVQLLLDTEGIGATGNLKNHDAKLSALASVFASNLLFNVMNTIDMESIHYLSDLAKFDDWFASRRENAACTENSDACSYDDSVTSYTTPPLTWIVQDGREYSLEEFNGSEELYLESALEEKRIPDPRPDDSEDDRRARKRLEDYNRIISRLKTKWSGSSATTARMPSILMFDHPKRGTRKRDLGKLAFHEYDKTYQQEIREARKILRETCRKQGPKMMSGGGSSGEGTPLTGQLFASQLMSLTRALNEQEHVGDALIKFQARSVAKSSLELFQRSIAEASVKFPTTPEADITILLQDSNESAMQAFRQGIWGETDDPANVEAYEQLATNTNSRARDVYAKNLRLNLGRCRRQARDDLNMIRKIQAQSSGEVSAGKFGCSMEDIRASQDANRQARVDVSDSLSVYHKLGAVIVSAPLISRYFDMPYIAHLISKAWAPSSSANLANVNGDNNVVKDRMKTRHSTASLLKTCQAHRRGIFAAGCSPSRWCDSTLWIDSPDHARSCIQELSEINSQYDTDTSEAFDARWKSLSSGVLVEILFVLVFTWVVFRVVGMCSPAASSAAGNARSVFTAVALVAVAEKVVMPHLSVLCASFGSDLERTLGVSNDNCREWPRNAVSMASSIISGAWQLAKAHIGVMYATVTIMALELFSARIEKLLRRCAPKVFGDAKDNEIRALRELEQQLRKENAEMRKSMVTQVRAGSAVAPPAPKAVSPSLDVESKKRKKRSEMFAAATNFENVKVFSASKSVPGTPLVSEKSSKRVKEVPKKAIAAPHGDENAGVNGTPLAATPKRRPRRGLRPRN